jgi:RNA polymerase sigma factor (sigma-70 family)
MDNEYLSPRVMDDLELLRDYATRRSEAAFAALVERYAPLVYSAALRQTDDAHLAEEITQTVFIILARKAGSISRVTILPGWLFRATRNVAADALKMQIRRHRREQQAAQMQTAVTNESNWEQIAPFLDSAVASLGEHDRNAVLLRFFENKSFAQIGTAMGINEEAARKRTARATEKLRFYFSNRGVALTAVTLTAAISANSVHAAPATLLKSATAIALAKGATAGASTLTLIKGALKVMALTKTQTAIVGLVIAGATWYSVTQNRARTQLRAENETLQQQMAQLQSDNKNLSRRVAQAERLARLAAPPAKFVAPPAAPPTETDNLSATNLMAQLLKSQGNDPRLTQQQAEAFLKANGRNAANLIAAFEASGDPALLQEAMQKFPEDPQVDFMAAMDKTLSPDQQRQWLNAFEASAPNNALANYLSALNYFNSGQNDQAVQELNAAAGKSQFQDYTVEAVQSMEEAYLNAGYSVANAELLSQSDIQLPQLTALKQLGQNMVTLANSYQQSGDSASAQAVLQLAVSLGQNVGDESGVQYTINSLVGMNIQYNALKDMDPNSQYDNNGDTVQNELDQLNQQRAALKSVNTQFYDSVLPAMSDPDMISFEQRKLIFGETSAEQWAIGKYAPQ